MMKRYLGLFAALLTIVMWSSLAALTLSVNHLPPLCTVGIVLIIASIPGLKHYRTWRLPIKDWLKAIIGMFGYHYLLFDAFSRAPAIEVNMIQYLWPLFIVLGTPLFGGQKLNVGHVLGAGLSFVAILMVMNNQQSEISSEHWLGYLEALCAALLWAHYTLTNCHNDRMSSSAVAAICLMSGLLSLGVFVMTMDQIPPIQLSDWVSLLLLGLGPMGLSFYSWDYAMRHGDPRFIGSLTYLTPLLSMMLLAVAFNSVTLSSLHLIALFTIILGASLGKVWPKFMHRNRTLYDVN
ncbi:DMT family transporter [Vibrio hippocampi]|uniref:Aromatic amino acid exporter YddG n=1 Tax=Vibrio hippocampi TaxID=654686 RepID=A0ABN8DSP1_9VIBR|nr:EamA family transporter [Vibrio hippocampi]CAH0530069.1 Aromatic amino acid exporter YddG [Vibrio hippocampi]